MPSADPRQNRTRRLLATLGLATLSMVIAGGVALAAEAGGVFDDVASDHIFSEDIEWMEDQGITHGCNPPDNTLFCPDEDVSRAQLAAFLHRLVSSDAVAGETGPTGKAGPSAYDIAVAAGFEGTEQEWLTSLQGTPGEPGTDGQDGANGASAYDIAVAAGFEGTEQEWLTSLQGTPGEPGTDGQDGANGASAYDIAVAAGFEGTEEEWLTSLQGAQGEQGPAGPQGPPGIVRIYVENDEEIVAPGAAKTASIDCSPDIVLSGGYVRQEQDPQFTVQSSQPLNSGRGWVVDARNMSSADRTLRIRAVCAELAE